MGLAVDVKSFWNTIFRLQKRYAGVQCSVESGRKKQPKLKERCMRVLRKPKLDDPEWVKPIRELRHRLGLNQEELGSRLHYSAMAISRWERG